MNPVGRGRLRGREGEADGARAAFGSAVPAVAAGLGQVISRRCLEECRPGVVARGGREAHCRADPRRQVERVGREAPEPADHGRRHRERAGRALQQFNTAAINRATAPIGVRVEGVGQSAVSEAGGCAEPGPTTTPRVDEGSMLKLRPEVRHRPGAAPADGAVPDASHAGKVQRNLAGTWSAAGYPRPGPCCPRPSRR